MKNKSKIKLIDSKSIALLVKRCLRRQEYRLTSKWSAIGERLPQTETMSSFPIGLLTREKEKTGGLTQMSKT